MLRFDGQRDVAGRTPDEVWARLSDARFLAECIPDVHQVKEAEAGRAVLVLRPGFAFVRGTLEVTLRVAEAVPPSSVVLALASRGIGTSSEVEARLALAAAGDGTRIDWAAEVKSLGGLLKAVPSGLIRGAAQKVIHDAWKAVAARLQRNEAPA
jgi:carbon monoxide dehydrogenase subunit G